MIQESYTPMLHVAYTTPLYPCLCELSTIFSYFTSFFFIYLIQHYYYITHLDEIPRTLNRHNYILPIPFRHACFRNMNQSLVPVNTTWRPQLSTTVLGEKLIRRCRESFLCQWTADVLFSLICTCADPLYTTTEVKAEAQVLHALLFGYSTSEWQC